MAWPITPIQAFISGTPILSTFLNSVQDAINKTLLGTYSHSAFVADGTGGNAVTPVAGTLKLSAQGLGTAIPSAVTPARYTFFRDMTPFAAAFGVNGTVSNTLLGNGSSFNISSVVRTGAGAYTFTFLTGTGGATGVWPIFCPTGRIFLSGVGFTSTTVTTITTVDTANVAADANFSILFFAI